LGAAALHATASAVRSGRAPALLAKLLPRRLRAEGRLERPIPPTPEVRRLHDPIRAPLADPEPMHAVAPPVASSGPTRPNALGLAPPATLVTDFTASLYHSSDGEVRVLHLRLDESSSPPAPTGIIYVAVPAGVWAGEPVDDVTLYARPLATPSGNREVTIVRLDHDTVVLAVPTAALSTESAELHVVVKAL